MPLALLGLGLKALGWLKLVPWQIWVIVGGLLAVMYYGHWKENQGRLACEQRVEQAAQAERIRQQQVLNKILADAVKEREGQEQMRLALEAQSKGLEDELAKLKNKDKECLPAGVADKLRQRVPNTKAPGSR